MEPYRSNAKPLPTKQLKSNRVEAKIIYRCDGALITGNRVFITEKNDIYYNAYDKRFELRATGINKFGNFLYDSKKIGMYQVDDNTLIPERFIERITFIKEDVMVDVPEKVETV